MNTVSIASLLPPALRGPLTLVAAAVVTVVCFAALAAPWLTPYRPNAMDLNGVLQAPSWTHLAGTDELGRDLLTRILHGARPSVAAAFGIVGIGTAFGLLIGTLSGLLSRWFDTVVMRLTDVVMALPGCARPQPVQCSSRPWRAGRARLHPRCTGPDTCPAGTRVRAGCAVDGG